MATATTAALPGADARTLVASYWTARRAAAVVVLVGFVVRFWVLASGWFSGTDHVLRIRAWESPFDLAYLSATGVPGSSPGMAAVQWPLSRLWPLDFTPLVLLLLALQCAVLLLVAVLVRQLWGDRWLGLVPLTIVAVAPVGLVAAAWWSVGLPTSLVQLATAGLLVAGVSWWRGGAAWGLLVAAAV
ncbi:MAG: hypothetical protein LCI03_20775, partial [Actinobacteria bacterium]|nr:hypothetical protein [Actinomycetota bacterium]